MARGRRQEPAQDAAIGGRQDPAQAKIRAEQERTSRETTRNVDLTSLKQEQSSEGIPTPDEMTLPTTKQEQGASSRQAQAAQAAQEALNFVLEDPAQQKILQADKERNSRETSRNVDLTSLEQEQTSVGVSTPEEMARKKQQRAVQRASRRSQSSAQEASNTVGEDPVQAKIRAEEERKSRESSTNNVDVTSLEQEPTTSLGGLTPEEMTRRRRQERAEQRAVRRSHVTQGATQQVTNAVEDPAQAKVRAEDSRRQQRAIVRASRRSQASSIHSQGSTGEDLARLKSQASGDQPPDRTRYPGLSDSELQRKYDEKMAQLEGREKPLDVETKSVDEDAKPMTTPDSKDPKTQDVANDGAIPNGTAAVHGITMTQPDVEYGAQPLVEENELAVAIPIDDEAEIEQMGEKFKNITYALEYDPDSKPPLHQNRRFRLYGIGGVILVVLLVAILVTGLVTAGNKKVKSLEGLPPTPPPTDAPTTALESQYRNFFASEVSPMVLVEGTPLWQAAEWIINDDPMALSPTASNLLQRFLLAFFYFHTSRDGEWRSCGYVPGEDTCVFAVFKRDEEDKIFYEDRAGGVRWLSGRDECKWEGVNCFEGFDIISLELCKLVLP